MRRKFKALVVLTAVAFQFSTATAASLPDEQKKIISAVDATYPKSQGELFDDLDTWSSIPSQLQPPAFELERLGLLKGTICANLADSACQKFLTINAKALLPVCQSDTTQYCIENFYAIKDGKKIAGVFKSYYPDQQTLGQFAAEPKHDLPAGGFGALWELPGITHDGGTDLYWVSSQLLGAVSRPSTNAPFGKMAINQMWSSVSAVSEVAAPSSKAAAASEFGGSGTDLRPQSADGGQCLVAGDGHCLVAWPLDQAITYGMQIRIPHPIQGWLHGRITDPDISTTTSSDGYFHVMMQGLPVQVPTLFASTTWSTASDAIKARFGSEPSGCCGLPGGGMYESAGRNQSSDQMVADLNMWLPYVKDTASAAPTYWIVRTISDAAGQSQKCLINGAVNGVVTTNATAYTTGAPIFNKKLGSLDYKVASPHFSPSGTPNIGNYNLQIRSDVARCLYGFTSAPVSATVSIISNNGSYQIATTTVSEKNGWIYLKAAGFTYSNPTVRVVFTQKKKVPVKKK